MGGEFSTLFYVFMENKEYFDLGAHSFIKMVEWKVLEILFFPFLSIYLRDVISYLMDTWNLSSMVQNEAQMIHSLQKSTCATNEEDFVSYVGEWHEAGATLVGGCCRTTPNTIKAISTALYNKAFNTKITQLM